MIIVLTGKLQPGLVPDVAKFEKVCIIISQEGAMASSPSKVQRVVICFVSFGVLPLLALFMVPHVFNGIQEVTGWDSNLFYRAFWSFLIGAVLLCAGLGVLLRQWLLKQCEPNHREHPETNMAR